MEEIDEAAVTIGTALNEVTHTLVEINATLQTMNTALVEIVHVLKWLGEGAEVVNGEELH